MTHYFFSNFGNGNVRNGQVQKALVLRALFADMFADIVSLDVRYSPLSQFSLFTQYKKGNTFHVSLGRNGIRLFALLLGLAGFLFGFRGKPAVYYFVVGGWISELAEKSTLLLRFLKACDGVFVEAPSLAQALRARGVTAHVFPNFRSSLPREPKAACHTPLRLCFCSRIREDKGALHAVALAEALNRSGREAILDFYGPIDEDFLLTFTARLSDRVRYKGAYDSEAEAVAIMRNYDFLVLPTRYLGECMPGAVIESFCAGTPVICSDWRYMPEIVTHDRNGLVIPLDNFAEQTTNRLNALLQENSGYRKMSAECVRSVKTDYSEAAARRILLKVLNANA